MLSFLPQHKQYSNINFKHILQSKNDWAQLCLTYPTLQTTKTSQKTLFHLPLLFLFKHRNEYQFHTRVTRRCQLRKRNCSSLSYVTSAYIFCIKWFRRGFFCFFDVLVVLNYGNESFCSTSNKQFTTISQEFPNSTNELILCLLTYLFLPR